MHPFGMRRKDTARPANKQEKQRFFTDFLADAPKFEKNAVFLSAINSKCYEEKCLQVDSLDARIYVRRVVCIC